MNDRETLVRYTEPWSREIVASSGGGREFLRDMAAFAMKISPALRL